MEKYVNTRKEIAKGIAEMFEEQNKREVCGKPVKNVEKGIRNVWK